MDSHKNYFYAVDILDEFSNITLKTYGVFEAKSHYSPQKAFTELRDGIAAMSDGKEFVITSFNNVT